MNRVPDDVCALGLDEGWKRDGVVRRTSTVNALYASARGTGSGAEQVSAASAVKQSDAAKGDGDQAAADAARAALHAHVER